MPATNFYATDNGNSARFGAIWTLNTPNVINDASPLGQQVLEEVNCTPGRAGAAVVNVTTGESVMAHADQIFGTSSTIKPAILLTLLRQKVDGEGVSLQTLLDLPVQIGANQGPDLGGPDGGPLQIGNDETLEYLARKMIDDSNNWATNMLIQYVGMDAINDELEDLGLDHTRLNRYMVGDRFTERPRQQRRLGRLRSRVGQRHDPAGVDDVPGRRARERRPARGRFLRQVLGAPRAERGRQRRRARRGCRRRRS